MPRFVVPILLVIAAVGVTVLVLRVTAGGDDGLDRTNAQAVFSAALEAIHDADLRALRPLLTKAAREQIERELRMLKKRLSHPEQAEVAARVVRDRLGDRSDDEIQRVVNGGLAETLRFYMLVNPRERSPQARGVKAEKFTRTFLYASSGGTVREVRLVLVHGKWFVQELQL